MQNSSEQLLQKLHFFLAFWSMNFDLSLLKNFHRVDVDKKVLVRVQFLVKRVNSWTYLFPSHYLLWLCSELELISNVLHFPDFSCFIQSLHIQYRKQEISHNIFNPLMHIVPICKSAFAARFLCVSVHFGTVCIKGLTFDSRLTPYIQESESSRVESFCAYSGTSKLNAQASQWSPVCTQYFIWMNIG